MAKKEFSYRGKSLAELQGMTKQQLADLFPSRIRRTLKRGYTDAGKTAEAKILAGDKVKTHVREIVILPQMVGKTVLVHNGKEFKEIRITEEMIGHVLGEFSPTRPTVKHSSPGVGATRSSSALSVR